MTYYCAVVALTLASVGVLCLITHESAHLSSADRRKLYVAYALIAASCVAECCGVALDGREGLPSWPLMLAKCADYILTPCAGGALVWQLGLHNRWNKILSCVIAGNAMLQVLALLGGWVVIVDAHNHYAHGPLYPIYVGTYLVVLAIVVVQSVAYGRSFSHENRASLYATIAVVISGIAMQETAGGEVRTAYLSLAMGAALLFIRNAEFSQLAQDETIGAQQATIMTDSLTGLLSRHAYAQRVAGLPTKADVPTNMVAFSMDLNNLKDVNDTLGHDAGDELIRSAAACVRHAFAGKGECYRTGGDEFVVLARMGREEADEALHTLLREADAWSGEEIQEMSLAAGYAIASDYPGLTVAELIDKADRAMYAAKEAHYHEMGIWDWREGQRMKTYPLTAAQRMHDIWIRDYGTQQVSGVSMVAALKAPMEFDVLRRCMQKEYERNGCMRLRFTKRNRQGEVKQYFSAKKRDIGEVPIVDLRDMSFDEANDTMQQWAYETFDGDNVPMFEYRMVRLPKGYNGFFLHMDHRLVDSSGLFVLVGDLFRLYASEVFETKEPDELADFARVLERDLAKASNERRLEKDRRFWDSQLDELGEPLYSDITGPGVLEESRQRHGDPNLRAADIEMEETFVTVKDYYLEPEPTSRLLRFCERNQLSVTNVLLLVIRTYLSKVNDGQQDITIQNFISRRSTRDEWASSGSRTIMFPCRTVLEPDIEFLDAAYEIQQAQNRIYLHGNYDPALIDEEMRRRWPRPEHTGYESFYLTYQPPSSSPERADLAGIPLYVKWFANGAATKKMYLTVSHTASGEMKFSYHYQTAHLEEHDVELLYYYMMKILFRGMAEPRATVGDIMAQV